MLLSHTFLLSGTAPHGKYFLITFIAHKLGKFVMPCHALMPYFLEPLEFLT